MGYYTPNPDPELIHALYKLDFKNHNERKIFKTDSCITQTKQNHNTDNSVKFNLYSFKTTPFCFFRLPYRSRLNFREWRIAGRFCLKFHKWSVSSALALTKAPCSNQRQNMVQYVIHMQIFPFQLSANRKLYSICEITAFLLKKIFCNKQYLTLADLALI